MHDATIGGIVGRQEIVLGARTTIDVAVRNKETGTFEVHVSIDVNPGIATNLHAGVSILLDGKLVELGQIVGGIVLGEERDATT